MKCIKLGKTDLLVSKICLGTANFGEKLSKDKAFSILDEFVDNGGNFIDTANVYCRWVAGLDNIGEQIIGEWMRKKSAKNSVVIATKGAHYNFSNPEISRVNKKDITADLEDSLKTLGLDCIDFYWLHRDDENTPIGEIIEVMEELVRAGKIRYYGASNYKQSRMEQAQKYAAQKGYAGFSAVSNQWSLAGINREKNMNPDPSLVFMDNPYFKWHLAEKMPSIPYSSTAHGFFQRMKNAGSVVQDGKLVSVEDEKLLPQGLMDAYLNERNLKIFEELSALSQQYGVSVHGLSLALMSSCGFDVVPVAAVSRNEQLKDFFDAGNIDVEKNLFQELGVS